MSGKPVGFHPEALAEAEAAVAWYRKRSLGAAERFVSELGKAIEAIGRAMERFEAASGGNVRKCAGDAKTTAACYSFRYSRFSAR